MIARAAADRLHRPVPAIAFPGSRNHQIVDCGMTSSGGTVPPTIIAIAAATAATRLARRIGELHCLRRLVYIRCSRFTPDDGDKLATAKGVKESQMFKSFLAHAR